ncbi:MAG: hypothetical protein Q9Q40_02260 [Acidobacteriota bacterium]|nr:hypothetical protein [Acidobacteriota bacterium]MDQ7087321.1 hypothetical protein [Acidobacteriota bacterium]
MKTVQCEDPLGSTTEENSSVECLPRRCRAATREDLERLEAGVSAQVLIASTDESVAPVSIRYMGRTIHAQPLDTRRFIQEMAAHICFN